MNEPITVWSLFYRGTPPVADEHGLSQWPRFPREWTLDNLYALRDEAIKAEVSFMKQGYQTSLGPVVIDRPMSLFSEDD